MQFFNIRNKVGVLLFTALLVFISGKAQQTSSASTTSATIASAPSGCSLTGTTSVVAGTAYYYRLTCSDGSSASSWVVTCGTTLSSDVDIIQVRWDAGCTSGTVKARNSGGTVLATLAVTINQPLSAGSISNSSQTINYNAVPAVINATAATGGNCGTSYSYQWESSTDNVNFANVSGATSQNYSPGNLTATTYFRRRVTCVSDILWTNTAVINVYPALQAGAVSPSSQNINYNTNASALTITGISGGSGSYTYQWQESANNTSFSDIAGATGSSYSPVALTTTKYYRVAVTSNGVTAYSTSGMVAVYPALQPGTLSPSSQTINYNNAPATLGATGVSGGNGSYGYQWQLSTDNSNFSNISGATGASYSPGSLTATTYYRVAVTSNGVTAYSSSGVVNVYPPVQPGTVSPSSQTINYNSAASTLTLIGSSGGGGSYSYQWQVSADGNNFTNVSNATGASYATGNLTATSYFRVVVTSNGANAYTNNVIVTVYPQLIGGSIIPAAQTINYNGTPADLSVSGVSGGNGSYTYQWQTSGDNSNYSNISGAAGSSYSPVNIPGTNYYRVAVNSNGVLTYSNASSVTVTPPPLVAGIITPGSLVIAGGTAPGILTANPATGGSCTSYNYQWQQSTDGNSFTDISGATSQNYTPAALTATTWFRRKVTCSQQTAYTNSCTISIGAVTATDINYIRARDITAPGILNNTAVLNLTNAFDVKQTTQYFDGLGRAIQTVSKQISPAGKDVIVPVVYDAYGREATKYLPYVSSGGDGNYRTNDLQEQNSFNASRFPGEQFYYGQAEYEPSPANRVLANYAPGQNWVGSSRGVKIQYAFNTVKDDVKIWRVTDVPNGWGNYGVNGSYAAGELSKNITVDEKGSQVIEFKNKAGLVVLKKVQLTAVADNGSGSGYVGWLNTYYVYDDLNQLRAVLQPRAVELLTNSGWQLTSTLLDELSFRYEYDQRQRMTMKKVPGAGEVWMVYDARDRLVMTQDANQRAAGKWLVTEYESQNRPWRTGLLTNGSDRTYHQNLAAQSTSYPNTTANYEMLTETYYDDYSWTAGAGLPATIDNTYSGNSTYFITGYNMSPVYAQPLVPDYMARGQVTGTKTKVLGTAGQYLYTVSFYDARGRVIQAQNINVTGGRDIVTTQYDFSGKPLRSLLQHQKSGSNAQTHLVLTKMNYDHAGRLLTVVKSINSVINGQPISKQDQTIAANSYDELGQLVNKEEGAGIETLQYDYNIRGWLLGVNRKYVNDAATNYFGFELGYDKTSSIVSGAAYANAQYNGNISGTVWKSKGDSEKRKYDFSYDNANRLTGADFNQQFGNSWAKTDPGNSTNRIDFSVNNLSYDANGNIITMQQQGWKPGGSVQIDDLKYTYNNSGNSNRLLAVSEGTGIGNIDNKLGDFSDKNTTQDDYSYDGNGNLTADKNKKIASISYNLLNLPAGITVNNDNNTLKGNITYTYDAAGNKLKKTVADIVTGITTTTLYIAGFEYKNDTLQQMGHEEGRIRYAKKYFYNGDSTYDFFYDYFLKDHLGNVRMVLTGQKDTTGYFATMEMGAGNGIRSKENQLFSNLDASSYLAANVPGGYPVDTSLTNPNLNVAKLNGSGQKMGPAIVLKVMAGDIIDLAVKSFYRSQGSAWSNSDGLTDILTSLATGVVNVSGGAKGTLTQLNDNTNSPLLGGLNLFRSANNGDPVGKPKAFLNWILLDERFNYVSSYPQSGALPVQDANVLRTLAYSGINITKSGYLYIYVSNETQNWDVFFDNLAIKHYSGAILEETHYYPFGLTMAGVSSKALGSIENKKKYNGIEQTTDLDVNQYDAFYRNLDPQIGRWWEIDPKIDNMEMWGPYVSNYNNPIRFSDFLGDTPEGYPIVTITQEVVGAAEQRLIGSYSGDDIPVTVDLYKVEVTDTEDPDFHMTFMTTRDAFTVLPGDDKGNELIISNTAFEPKDGNVNHYTAVPIPGGYPSGNGTTAFKLTQNGSEVMYAEPNQNAVKSNTRTKSDVAAGVMQHVGGYYNKNGEKRLAASEGCFGVVNKRNSSNNPSNAVSNNVMGRIIKQAQKSKTSPGKIEYVIQKRKSIPDKLKIDKNGKPL